MNDVFGACDATWFSGNPIKCLVKHFRAVKVVAMINNLNDAAAKQRDQRQLEGA